MRRAGTVLVMALLAACSGTDAATTTTMATQAPTSAAEGGALMELTSPAFDHEGAIPARFTCDGEDVSPELHIAGTPDAAVSLVVIMEDPDAPRGTWDHWVAFDITPVESIPEDVGAVGTAGLNTSGRTGYGGPCPPSGTHRYFFRVLALDGALGLAEGATKGEVLAAAEGHVLAEAVLMGTYSR